MSNKTDLKFLCVIGYAGHGKDTIKNILKSHYDGNDFVNLSYADTMKKQIANALPNEIINVGEGESRLDKLNDLKDNHPNVEVLFGKNARQLLQNIGTEFYRALDEDIHVRFSADKVLKHLEESKKENLVFASSDTRFPNELNFLLKASQFKENEQLKDFLKDFLKKSPELPEKEEALNFFKQVFNVENLSEVGSNLFNNIYKDIESLKKVPEPETSHNLVIPDTSKMSKEQAASYGVVHVFRPLVEQNVELKDTASETDIMAKVKSYTQSSMNDVLDIREKYRHYGVDFNTQNIKKYGYLRADINHSSENAIDQKKPEPFISAPMSNPLIKEQFVNELTKVFDESVGKKNNQKLKMNNKRGNNEFKAR